MEVNNRKPNIHEPDKGRSPRRMRSSSRSPSYSPRLSLSRSPSPSSDAVHQSRRPASADSSKQHNPDSLPFHSPRRRRDSQSPSPGRRTAEQRGASRRSVVVVGLSRMVYEVHLEQIFGMYGAIEDVIVPRERHSSEHGGIAYIIYQSASSVAKAEDNMTGGQVDGCVIDVRQEEVPRHEYDAARRRRTGSSRGSGGRRDRRGRQRSDREERHSSRQAQHSSDRRQRQ